jgi:phage baseplate assembly protein W
MDIEYYKYPLDLKRIFQQKKLQKCTLGDAISQNLQLIILSHNGEHRYNPSLGCEIWDLDFDLILSLRIWEEKLRSSLLHAIDKNEKTLENVEVSVAVSEVENTFNFNQYVSIKRQVDIQVHAVLKETGEKYYFQTKLFLSPVSAQ